MSFLFDGNRICLFPNKFLRRNRESAESAAQHAHIKLDTYTLTDETLKQMILPEHINEYDGIFSTFS